MVDSLHEDFSKLVPNRVFFSLAECAQLKGVNLKTLQNRKYLQPNGGRFDAVVTGRKLYKRETVIRWLPMSDDEICEQVLGVKND